MILFFLLKENWKYEPIVPWNNLVKNISWGVIFLLGAGLSVASAFTVCIMLIFKKHIYFFLFN